MEVEARNAPVGLADVVEDEVTNLPLDVGRLVADRDLRKSRQVDESEVKDIGRVDLCAKAHRTVQSVRMKEWKGERIGEG
jgi:hypothetical protein